MSGDPLAPFDALYRTSPDPWGTETRWYERRKRALLLHFGTAGKVRAAALEDLQRAPGVSATVAQQIYDFYHAGG